MEQTPQDGAAGKEPLVEILLHQAAAQGLEIRPEWRDSVLDHLRTAERMVELLKRDTP